LAFFLIEKKRKNDLRHYSTVSKQREHAFEITSLL